MTRLHRLIRVDLRGAKDPDRRAEFVRDAHLGLSRDGFILVEGFEGELERVYQPYDRARRQLFSFGDAVLRKYEPVGADGKPHRQRGFSPLGSENSKDAPLGSDGKPIGDLKRFWMTRLEEVPENPSDNPFGPNVWPVEVPSFRPYAIAYMMLLVTAGRAVLGALDEYYGFKDGRLVAMTRGSETMLRSIHYPTVDRLKAARGAVRSRQHEDINLLTGMKAVHGLQLLLDGEWVDIESPPDTAIMNSGDMIVPVDDIHDLHAVTHQVVNPPLDDDSERFSDPLFIHATHSTWLNPKLRAGDWLMQRLQEING